MYIVIKRTLITEILVHLIFLLVEKNDFLVKNFCNLRKHNKFFQYFSHEYQYKIVEKITVKRFYSSGLYYQRS